MIQLGLNGSVFYVNRLQFKEIPMYGFPIRFFGKECKVCYLDDTTIGISLISNDPKDFINIFEEVL